MQFLKKLIVAAATNPLVRRGGISLVKQTCCLDVVWRERSKTLGREKCESTYIWMFHKLIRLESMEGNPQTYLRLAYRLLTTYSVDDQSGNVLKESVSIYWNILFQISERRYQCFTSFLKSRICEFNIGSQIYIGKERTWKFFILQ